MFVGTKNIRDLKKIALHESPDVFSLDIDGIDYHVAEAILSCGLRPKIFVVEYNSAFGPDRSITIPYSDDFIFTETHASHLYYGVSISGWRKFFTSAGYHFVTVDSKGVNAFFVDSRWFKDEFLAGVRGVDFCENRYQLIKFKGDHAKQFPLIKDLPLISIE